VAHPTGTSSLHSGAQWSIELLALSLIRGELARASEGMEILSIPLNPETGLSGAPGRVSQLTVHSPSGIAACGLQLGA